MTIEIYCHGLYPRRRPRNRTPECISYLRDNVGIDPAILAADLGIHINWVLAWQRQLGVRPFACKAPNTRAMRKERAISND